MTFHLANWRPQLLLLLSLLAQCSLTSAGVAEGQSKPAMTIIIERGELLAEQTVGLHVWIENPTEARMTNIRFSYAGPSFLEIGTWDGKTCDTKKGTVFPAVEPNSALERLPQLCLHAKSNVEERDWSLGFSVTYTLEKDGKSTSGLLVAEKKLSVGLFGTESVGGVSLRLAAYVLPGLLFMMILRMGRFPWLGTLGGSDVATLSVLISVFLSLILSFIVAKMSGSSSTFPGIGSAVSTELFLSLCATAIVVSGLMVLIHWWVTTSREHKRRALLVETTDDLATVLRKALGRAGGDLRPFTVITQDQKRFVGSLMADKSDGGVALVGWCQLPRPEDEPLRNQLDGLINNNRLLEALDLARQHRIEPEMRDPVKTFSPEGQLGLTADTVRRFPPTAVQESSQGAVQGLGDERPLVLASP